MGFGQILFLFGIAAVIGPILIHLLIRPRFKRIPYTMIDFLEVSHKQSRAKRRLRQWLVLLMRCAIVALLACVFALPFLKRPGQTVDPPERHFVVVDNSLSMTYQDQGRTLLDRAIERAVQYVQDQKVANALFDIYAGSGRCQGNELTPVEAAQVLKGIAPSAHKAEMTEVSTTIGAAIQDNAKAYLYLVSDFTPAAIESLSSLQSIRGLQGVDYDVVLVEEPANALVNDARVLRYHSGTVELSVQVENTGDVAQTRMLGASVEGQDVDITVDDAAVALEPTQSGRFLLKLKLPDQIAGRVFLPVKVSLSPPDSLTADDTYYLGLQIEPSRQKRVLIVGRDEEQGFLVTEALKAISRADFDNNLIVRSSTGPILDRAGLDMSDVLICGHVDAGFGENAEALDRFLARGGTAVFFVSREMSLGDAASLYRQGIIGAEPFELIDQRHAVSGSWPADGVFTNAGLDVDTARATRQYTLDSTPLWSHFACRPRPETTSLWPIETGHCLVYSLAKGAGKSLLINTSMDDTMSALTKRPVVIPLCKLILGSGSTAYGYGFHVEESIALPVSEFEQADSESWVLTPSGQRHRVTVTGSSLTGRFPDRIGWVQTVADPVRYAGINVAVGETDLRSVDSTEIDQRLAGLTEGKTESNPTNLATTEMDSNRPLWKFLAWILIALVLLEGFVVNRIAR